MKICFVCSFKNEPTAQVCTRCGQTLFDAQEHTTNRQQLTWRLKPRVSWGDIRLPPNAVLVLHIMTVAEPLVLPRREQLLLGRVGAPSLRNPDIDLTPYDALQRGVSRLHAAIDLKDEAVFITDLGSTNGTYLNASRLSPGEPRIVCSGDELCFGNLMSYLYFRGLTSSETGQ